MNTSFFVRYFVLTLGHFTSLFILLCIKNPKMEKYSSAIKQWAFEDRPREKLAAKGNKALSDVELLAILIGSGTKNMSAVELARSIMADVNNNLVELGKLSVDDLQKRYKGVGQAKAITIIAAIELGKRRAGTDAIKLPKIKCSNDAYQAIHSSLADLPHEEFWILLLNRNNQVLKKEKITQGGITSTIFDVRMILKSALDRLATGIIICHNHPSGNLRPSDSDKQITYKMKEAGKLMDIQLLDHIIVCGQKYFSFADEGIL